MGTITVVEDDPQDGWIFDTVKASTMAAPMTMQRCTEKRRKVSIVHTEVQEDPEEMLSRLTLDESRQKTLSPPPPSTMRKATAKRRSSPSGAASPAKRRPSGQRQPLAPSTSFGNGASTVRQFRRVSDNSPNATPNISIRRDENERPVTEPVTKESLLGRRAYSKVIDPAFQESCAQSANHSRREAMSQAALAWDALNKDDPEGEYLLLRLIIEKVQR